MTTTPPPAVTASTVLDVSPDAVKVARHHVVHTITGLGLERDMVSAAELLVSETVGYLANGGGGRHLDLTVSVDAGNLTVTVTGRSVDPPSLATAPYTPPGLGLRALDRRDSTWGILQQKSTTSVWFRLNSPTGAAALRGLLPSPMATRYSEAEELPRSELLSRITEVLATAGTSPVISDGVTALIRSHLGAAFTGIAVHDPMAASRMRYVSTDPLDEQTSLAWIEIPIDDATPVGDAVATSRATFLPSLRAADAVFPGTGAVLELMGLKAVAHLPLVLEAGVIGVLSVGWADDHSVTPDEQTLLRTVAGYVAQAVGRVSERSAEAGPDQVAQLVAAAVAPALAPAGTFATADARQRSLRVMLVDDTADVRLLLAALFARRPDVQVVAEAVNGEEAILLAAALQPDLIVLDIAMPVLDGISALPQLRSAAPNARVVVLSALAPDRQASAAIAAGAAAYVQKSTPVGTLVEDLLDGARLLDVAVRELTPHAALTFDADPRQVVLARRFLGHVLRRWNHVELADTIALLLSELVTNAIVHAQAAPNVTVRLLPDHVHVEVSDTSPIAVAPRALTNDQPSGRGFALIDALAEKWGTASLPTGKVVWFDVSRHAASRSPAA